MKPVRLSVAALMLPAALMCACGEERREGGARAPSSGGGTLLAVVISWPGDDFAGDEEIGFRDGIARLIEERGLGRVVSRGTGMGTAEIVVSPAPETDFRGELREIMLLAAPDISYRIEERLPFERGAGQKPLQTPPPAAQ